MVQTSFENDTLTAVFDHGEKKSFLCHDTLSLAKRAWWRRLRLAYCTENGLDPDSASITLMDLLTFTLDSEDRTLEALHLGYPGDHTDIDWYNASEPDAVEEALAYFFLACFEPQSVKTSASVTSSSLGETGLAAA